MKKLLAHFIDISYDCHVGYREMEGDDSSLWNYTCRPYEILYFVKV